jgi:hypothetical protein
MDLPNDPNDRRRLDAEDLRNRDAEVARLRGHGVPFRVIAARLNMSLGAVQKSVRRAQKLSGAPSTGEPASVLTAVSDELSAEDVRTPGDCERLNALELHRLRYYPPDSPQRRALAAWVPSPAWVAAHPAPELVTYPVSDGESWRERCDAALADDSGVDADDDW